jgi:hypothetical protein
MLKIKQHKFIWLGIIVLGVTLLGMPAVYAQDGQPMPDPAADEANLDEDYYDADSDDPDLTLSDTDEDFVFTPVSPCRIIDTRKAGGPIGNFSSRSFYVLGANLSGQGGNAAGCNSPVGEPSAVLMNIVAVNSTAPGYLTVWPYGETRPLAAVLNYSPTDKTDPISNAFAVKTSGASGLDISVYAYKQTHVVADVLGYFSKPEATPVQISTVAQSVSVAPGNYGYKIASCSAGYTRTGGGCKWNTSGPSFSYSYPTSSNGWLCGGINTGSITRLITAYAICARVPGR